MALDFNRSGDATLARWMLAIAAREAPLQLVDPALPARHVTLGTEPSSAAFVASGRCLVQTYGSGRADVLSSFGFVRLFGLAGGAGTVRAMALGATEYFALLRDDARIEFYEQPLCGDAEALCRFAGPRLKPMAGDHRLRYLPPAADGPVSQPPGPACSALIERVLPGWR